MTGWQPWIMEPFTKAATICHVVNETNLIIF